VYRFITAALTHGGLLHLAFNMLALLPVGELAIQSTLPARLPACLPAASRMVHLHL
jgi:membrane associated rhomboid family serine protease